MNKETNKLLPDLRFPEFVKDGEWEEKIVEDYFEVGSSKRILQKDWTIKGVPFYRTRELVSLSKNEPFGSDIYISEELFSELKEKYGVPSEGDFLVSGVGTLGICYQVKKEDRFYFKDGNVLWFKLEGDLYSAYFKYCFLSEHIQNQITAQASISTVGTYTIQNAKKSKFWHPPTIKEQQKIASCLSSLDELIESHTQKLVALKNHKKGLMQNLFPQEGEKTPKIRFPEFVKEGEWEEKKLGNKEISILVNDKVSVNMLNLDSYISTENMLSDYSGIITAVKLPASGSFTKFIEGDILISNIRPYLKKVWKSNKKGSTSNDVFVFRAGSKVLSQFLENILKNDTFISHMMKSAKGVKMPRGDKTSISQYFVLIPSPKEQQKIASCLSTLDDLITAQAEKIEKLKKHKKGLMQGLFPKMDTRGVAPYSSQNYDNMQIHGLRP